MQEAAVVLVLLALTAHSVGVPAPQVGSQTIIKYEKGDCIHVTLDCLLDDSCGPLLRIVYAYCYETVDFIRKRPDGSRLECDSSCSILLSVLFNNSIGIRLKECNYNSNQFWTQIVVQKQRACSRLLVKTDALLKRALEGKSRSECWLAGLLCAKDFSCRSTLTAVLELPCYNGPCSPDCAARLINFAEAFGDIFHTFLSCLCGQDLLAACSNTVSGYLENRSAALDQLAFASPLDGLVEQLGRGAIHQQMQDIIWLLQLFEHPIYCRSIKAIIREATCLPKLRAQPSVTEPLCAIDPAIGLPSTTAGLSTTPPTAAASSSSDTYPALKTQWQQPTGNPKGAAAADSTVPVDGARRLNQELENQFLLTCSSLIFLTTKLINCSE